MISNELSMIQYNSFHSAILGAQVEEFLRQGGQIDAAPPLEYKPRPPAYHPVTVRKPAKPKAPKKLGRPPRTHGQELIDRIAAAAETMTCTEAAEHFGLSVNQAHCLAYRYGFRYMARARKHPPVAPRKAADPEQDRAAVERILAFKEIGLSRHQAMKQLHMSAGRFARILHDHQIDYPKARSVSVWVMPS